MSSRGQHSVTWRRWIFVMGSCFFGLAALSIFRLWFIGTPNLDGLPLNLPWEIARRTIFFLLMTGVGLAFLKLMNQEINETDLTKLFLSSLLVQLIAFLVLPLTSNDIFSNLAYGKMAHLGLSPDHLGAYALSLGDPFRQMVTDRWMHMPMVYGPIIGWLNRLLTQPNSLWESIIVYKCAALFLSLTITVLILLYCRRCLTGPAQCNSFILFALNPVFLWELCSQAHNDSVMIIGTLGFIFFATKNRAWEALACLLFAFVTKLAVLPALGLYLCYTFFNSRTRFLWFCLLLGVGSLFFVYYFSEKLGVVLVVPASQGIDSTRLTNTPLYLIYRFLQPAGAHVQAWAYRIYWIGSMLFMAQLGIRFAWRSRTLEQLFLYTLLFIFLFNLIASPTYQPWYVTWILPFAMTLKDQRLRHFIALYSVISVVQYAILNSLVGSVINLSILGMFWFKYWKDASVWSPKLLKQLS